MTIRICVNCGTVGAIEDFPKANIQAGKQYYKLVCKKCYAASKRVIPVAPAVTGPTKATWPLTKEQCRYHDKYND